MVNQSKIWISADLHFGHNQEFIYGSRGFKSIQEHDKQIIENWNSVIKKDDLVFLLGDIMLNDNEHGLDCLMRLNGIITIILGNHDSEHRIQLYNCCPNVAKVRYATLLKYKKCNFYLSHYPTITANELDNSPYHKNLISLYGHTHQKTKFFNDNPYMYCTCLDAHNNYPVCIDAIIEDIKNKIKINERSITCKLSI